MLADMWLLGLQNLVARRCGACTCSYSRSCTRSGDAAALSCHSCGRQHTEREEAHVGEQAADSHHLTGPAAGDSPAMSITDVSWQP